MGGFGGMTGGTSATPTTGSSSFGGATTPNAYASEMQSASSPMNMSSLLQSLFSQQYSPTAGVNPVLPQQQQQQPDTTGGGGFAAGVLPQTSNLGFGGGGMNNMPSWLSNILGYGGLFPGGPQGGAGNPALNSGGYLRSSVNEAAAAASPPPPALFDPSVMNPKPVAPAAPAPAAPAAPQEPQYTLLQRNAPGGYNTPGLQQPMYVSDMWNGSSSQQMATPQLGGGYNSPQVVSGGIYTDQKGGYFAKDPSGKMTALEGLPLTVAKGLGQAYGY